MTSFDAVRDMYKGFERWFAERLERDPAGTVVTTDAYADYAAFCAGRHVVESRKRFTKEMQSMGIPTRRTAKHRYYLGMRLRPDPAESSI